MKKIISFFLFCFTVFSVYSQLYRQTSTNFTPREYGQGYSSYTQAVTEDDQGLIYIGTVYGILQYDGYSWRYIPVKLGANVTSLAFYNKTVYVGSQGDFGYLKADNYGKLCYYSLSDKLNDTDKNFSTVRKTLVFDNKIAFQSEEGIFIYDNNKISVIKPKTSFHLAFTNNNKLYVRDRSIGLAEYTDNEFKPVTGGDIFTEFGIFAILPYQNNSKLIITQELGFYKWDNDGFTPIELNSDQQNLLINSMIIGGKLLSDGNFALYSLKNGIFILDKTLNIITSYSINTGMRSSEVYDLIQDSNGNIWSATQKGVNRLQYSSPVSFFNETSGIYGNVQAVGVFNNSYLIGTSEGLFISDFEGMKLFREVSEIKGSVGVIRQTMNGLWIGTANGLWYFDGKIIKQINQVQSLGLLYIPEQNWIISAGASGLRVINSDNFLQLLTIDDIKIDVYGIAYQMSNDNVYQIWLGSKTQGVWQLDIYEDLKYNIDFYFVDDGLSADWVCAYQSGKNIIFGTSLGVFRFISTEEMKVLANDTSLNERGFFNILDFPNNSNGKSITAFWHGENESEIAMDSYIYNINMKDSSSDNSKYKTLQLGRFNVIEKSGKQLLIGGDDGLAAIDREKEDSFYFSKPVILLRKISIGKDSVIWSGDVPYSGNSITIPYKLNSVNIEYASLYSDNGFKLQYAWRVEGEDEEFTNWSSDNKLTLSNLREGDYKLHIIAKNPQDVMSNELTFDIKSNELILSISIQSPWYRTYLAYFIYLLIGIGIIYLIIQLNLRRLKANNRRLEEIVTIRTKEVVEQKEEIEIQKETIEEILQDINASISYALRIQQALLPSREFIKICFPDHFILYMPRNVVSGDFYWATSINNWTLITAADCTGHGVPGAFMSMLGISFLNEIVRKKEVTDAAMVLNKLRDAIIEALKQTGGTGTQKDGMDMSLCAINTENYKCLWSGANNPLWYIKNENINKEFEDVLDKVEEIKADKMPVAIHITLTPFTNHELQLNKGDKLYLFTDGYPDQFGGSKGKKFMYKAFRQLLAENSALPMEMQGIELKKAYDMWVNFEGQVHEQVDDVTVIGICI
ncbi:MAG: SpoIIE family protein phosphatase [Bacteroidota bacterium]